MSILLEARKSLISCRWGRSPLAFQAMMLREF
jgi:hypothetical protein